eukprot:GDKJ01032028.1.p1 GENE.GDKJ01032028.1~~GDKJ01032028.1.p1  ORF type:complete len:272 (+),score=25.12 GDKJ01032028.1:1-816(+)
MGTRRLFMEPSNVEIARRNPSSLVILTLLSALVLSSCVLFVLFGMNLFTTEKCPQWNPNKLKILYWIILGCFGVLISSWISTLDCVKCKKNDESDNESIASNETNTLVPVHPMQFSSLNIFCLIISLVFIGAAIMMIFSIFSNLESMTACNKGIYASAMGFAIVTIFSVLVLLVTSCTVCCFSLIALSKKTYINSASFRVDHSLERGDPSLATRLGHAEDAPFNQPTPTNEHPSQGRSSLLNQWGVIRSELKRGDVVGRVSTVHHLPKKEM